MYDWKLTQTLSNPKDAEWENLALVTLGKNIHLDRKMGLFLSREALKNVLESQGVSLEIPELKLSHYHQLLSAPQFTISLSHTRECGAALVAQRKDFRSVGIDIENSERPVKENIFQRISHSEDLALRKIEIWCLKEAAFKALMNTDQFEKPVEFSSINISKNRWSHSPSGLEGEWKLYEDLGFTVALAFLKN